MATGRSFDPRRLDVAGLAQAGARLQGRWPQADLPRLAQDALPWADGAAPQVDWAVRGEHRPVVGGEPQIRLHLQVHTAVRLVCQRCLAPVTVPLQVDTSIRFVPDEAQAEKLDEDNEEDVLALPARLDLRDLIEDELILALPLAPRHERCPDPLPTSAGEDESHAAEAAEQPFAALASLLRDGGGKPN